MLAIGNHEVTSTPRAPSGVPLALSPLTRTSYRPRGGFLAAAEHLPGGGRKMRAAVRASMKHAKKFPFFWPSKIFPQILLGDW
jgi:hypothetical protein